LGCSCAERLRPALPRDVSVVAVFVAGWIMKNVDEDNAGMTGAGRTEVRILKHDARISPIPGFVTRRLMAASRVFGRELQCRAVGNPVKVIDHAGTHNVDAALDGGLQIIGGGVPAGRNLIFGAGSRAF
jgi:hypothetical protein